MKTNLLSVFLAWSIIFVMQEAFGDYPCACDEGWYSAASGSFSWSNDTVFGDRSRASHKMGGGVNVSIGYIVDGWRLEIEGIYRQYENDKFTDVAGASFVDGGHLRYRGGFLNLLYDIPIYDRFAIYLGGGVGALESVITIEAGSGGSMKDEDTNFAWDLLGGVAFCINRCWALTLGYRFFTTTKPRYKTISDPNDTPKLIRTPYANNIDLGLRLRF